MPEKNLPGKGYVTIASVKSVNPPQNSNREDGNNKVVVNGSMKNDDDAEDSISSGSSMKDVRFSSDVPTVSKYVSLAHFQGQKVGDISGGVQNGGG